MLSGTGKKAVLPPGGEPMKSGLKIKKTELPAVADVDGRRGPDRRFLLLSLSALGVVYGDAYLVHDPQCIAGDGFLQDSARTGC